MVPRAMAAATSEQLSLKDAEVALGGVSEVSEFCIKNDKLCIYNEELCITNDDFCSPQAPGRCAKT